MSVLARSMAMAEERKGVNAAFFIGVVVVLVMAVTAIIAGTSAPDPDASFSGFSDSGDSETGPKKDGENGSDATVPVDTDSGSKDFEVSPSYVYSQITDGGEPVKLIDVRSGYEYTAQHLKNAILLPSENINQGELDKLGLGKDDKIIVYCNAGVRSAKAYRILVSLGYTNVKSMTGGIVEWTNEGFPTEG